MSAVTTAPASNPIAVAPPAPEMVNVQVDGVWKQFPKGIKLIDACHDAGKEIPHYCYHPKLSTPGNCRMCLIEMGMPKMGPDRKPELDADGRPLIAWMPRPTISCAQTISEGMAVRTSSPMVQECRKGVMEFLLINHPLDCPVCDQAGECKLQEFSVEYGQGESRFLDEKVKKPKHVELGPRITLDDERCILCSRCVRFSKEIAEDDVLGFVERGSYNTLTCHPGRKLDNNYSLNTVDICPVGALTSNDFRFKMRVWFLKETKSLCTSCGTGCNTIIGSRQEKVYRQTPRDNSAVNECWMCDHGRLDFHHLEAPARPLHPLVRTPDGESAVSSWKDATAAAATLLRSVGDGTHIALIASGRMTNEELFLAARLAETLGTTQVDIVPRVQDGDKILVSSDGNPNTNGAKLLGLASATPGDKLAAIKSGVQSGQISALVLLGGEDASAALGLSAEELSGLKAIVTLGHLASLSTAAAHVVFPGAGFAEKRGSMININGRLQRLNKAVAIPGSARDDWEILRDLVAALGGGNGIYLVDDLFRQMAATRPELRGLSLSKIGDLGLQVLDLPREPRKIGHA